jgi:hypothetical protein
MKIITQDKIIIEIVGLEVDGETFGDYLKRIGRDNQAMFISYIDDKYLNTHSVYLIKEDTLSYLGLDRFVLINKFNKYYQ